MIAHTGREDAREVAGQFCRSLHAHGIAAAAARGRGRRAGPGPPRRRGRRSRPPRPAADCELALVIGGDGTILRAAELTRECGTPLLGRQPRPRRLPGRGRVGRRGHHHRGDRAPALHRRGAAHPRRLGLPRRHKELVTTTWALNEASVEKAARERMIEVVVEVDGRPLSRWGCDGVVCATPDRLDRLQLQRRRPDRLARGRGPADGADQRARAVRAPAGRGADLGARGRGDRPHRGLRACCGATAVAPSTCRPAPASRYAAARTPVRLVRLHQAPFTDRLVAKFDLPVSGWRGAAERRRRDERRRRAVRTVLEELRISSLGVIDESVLELGPGFTAITGETGAGKTMVVTALGPAARRPRRLRRRPHRRASRPRRGPRARGRPRRSPRPSTRPAARSRTAGWCWPGRSRPRAARAPSPAAPRSRSPPCPRWPTRWSRCTASPTSTGCCARPPSATRSTASPAR